MSVNAAFFHMHEESTRNNELSPKTLKGTSIALGLFVDDPHADMEKAVAAGDIEIDPVQDYDYDYRQGTFVTHSDHWAIQKKIG